VLKAPLNPNQPYQLMSCVVCRIYR